MARIEIGAAVSHSFGFVRQAWAVAPASMVLVVLTAAAAEGYATVHSGLSLWQVAGAVVGVLATGALYRSVLMESHPDDASFRVGPAGLQWGVLEWRILGANIIVGLVFLAVGLAVFVLWALGLGVLAASHVIDLASFQNLRNEGMAGLATLMAGPAGAVTVLILLPGAAALLYLAARLSLLAIHAADTGRFDIRAAWAATRGVTGAIIVTLIVIILFLFVVDAVVGGVAGGLAGAYAAMTGGDAKTQGALLGSIVGAAAGAAFSVPMTAGMVTYVYRTQGAGDAPAARPLA